MSAFVSGKEIQLKAKLNPVDNSLTADIDVGITEGRLYFINDIQEEWLDFTGVAPSGSDYIYSGLTRGLSQTVDPATAGTGLTWLAGNKAVVVAMHDQLQDKTNFSQLKQEGLTYATEAARDADLGGDGVATLAYTDIWVTATGLFYNYNLSGNQWEGIETGTVVQNASETVAGKLEIASVSESINGTDTGGTGALLSVLPSDIAANTQSSTFEYAEDAGTDDAYVITLTPSLTTYTTGQKIRFKANTVNTGACTINIDGLGVKNIKDRAGNDPVDGLIGADDILDLYYDGTNFVIDSSPKVATNAEAIVGNNEALIPNIYQLPVFPGTDVTYKTFTTTTDTYELTRSGTYLLDIGVTSSNSGISQILVRIGAYSYTIDSSGNIGAGDAYNKIIQFSGSAGDIVTYTVTGTGLQGGSNVLIQGNK